jgi:hypothetical protein
MSNKIPFYKPIKFSGAIHENVDLFIRNYNKASTINGWSTEQKITFLCIYLNDTALTFLDNFERTNPNATWDNIENAFRLEFEHPARKYMLKTILEKKTQLPGESIASYINDTENLCKQIDSNMSQTELTYNIIKGLKLEIARFIGILDNNNLQDLKKNIKKYEHIEFMLNNKTSQVPNEFKSQITKEHINIINKNETQTKLEQLSSKISNLESILKNMNLNRNYNENTYTNSFKYNNTFSQLNSNINHHYNNKFRSNNTKNYQNPNPNNPNNLNNYNNKPIYPNFGHKTQCEHCNKYNHNSQECKWKLICDFCNKRYHTSEICYSKIQFTNQKPVNRSNTQTGNLHRPSIPVSKNNSNSCQITPAENVINLETKIMSNKCPQATKDIDTFENQIVDSINIIEEYIDILKTTPKYSIVQCISAD